jgi:hypothetical protein
MVTRPFWATAVSAALIVPKLLSPSLSSAMPMLPSPS